MIPIRRASNTHSNDLHTSGIPMAISGPSRSTKLTSKPQSLHNNNTYYCHPSDSSEYAMEPTYAEFLSLNDDWLDPYSLSPSESSSSQRRKRSTTCELKSDTSTMVYTTALRPRAKSLRDTKATDFETTTRHDGGYQSLDKKWTDRGPAKHTHNHLPRARSRILKSPPPPPALDLDQQPPSLPNVDVQQIKDELSASVSAHYLYGKDDKPPPQLPRRQKSLQHHHRPATTTSRETASVISNVKRKLSLKDRAERDTDQIINTTTLAKTGLYETGARKSSTPSRASLADYQGTPRSSISRRRSVYSPPPRSSTRKKDDGWTTSDDDGGGRLSSTSTSSLIGQDNYDYGFIPPVPPVPKHHSIKTPTLHTNDDDDVILASLTAGSSQRNNISRGTFGSFEEIIQQSQLHYPTHNGDGDMDIPTQRTKTRTPKKQQEQYQHHHQDTSTYHSKESPSLLPIRTSSRKNNNNSNISPKMTAQQKADEGKKVINRKRGRTLPGSLATPPPIPAMPLPPMKLEPIYITLPPNDNNTTTRLLQRQSSNATPSRIPKPPSALSFGSVSSSTNNTPTKNILSYASSEDEEAALNRSRRNKSSMIMKGSYSTTTLTPSAQQRRSLKTSSASASSISPKASPKSSPRMKHSRSASSTNLGDTSASPLSSSLPASHHLQRKLSRNGKTPTEPVPKLPTTMTDFGSTTKTPRQSNRTVTGNSTVSAPSQTGTLNRATSLHSTRGNNIAGSKDKSSRKDRSRTFSLHDKIQSSIPQEPQFIMLDTNTVLSNRQQPSSTTTNTVQQPIAPPPTTVNGDHEPKTQAPIRTAKSPQTALKYYSQYLTSFEQTEILDFQHIYFIGPHAKKLQATTTKHDHHHHHRQQQQQQQQQATLPPSAPVYNNGYDDENGDYKIIRQDHLIYRYEILDVLGQGSFGQVVKCFDHKTGATVAIKLIRNKKRFHAQALTEIKILRNLVDWDPEDKHHNIRMTDYFYFRHHLCIAFECMGMNLYEFIKKNNFQGFSVGLIRKFTIQILQSLTLLYQHRVVHCDLKPENILLKHPGKSTIKVIDFGSSCLETERVYTYIQSRFYRSPEVILGISYNMAIDMWSVGCILAELHTGIPLFPGESEQEQLGCIMEVLGQPARYLIDQSSRKKLFFDSQGNARMVVNSKGKRRLPGTKSLAHVLRSTDMQFLDFVQGCLQWDPANRLTPMDAMNHEWIQQRTNLTTTAYQFPSNNYQRLDDYKTKKQQQQLPPTTPKMTATAYYQSLRKHSIG